MVRHTVNKIHVEGNIYLFYCTIFIRSNNKVKNNELQGNTRMKTQLKSEDRLKSLNLMFLILK